MKKFVFTIVTIIILSSSFYLSNPVEIGDDMWPRTNSVIEQG